MWFYDKMSGLVQAWTYKKLGFPVPYLVVGRWGVTPFPAPTPLRFIVGEPLSAVDAGSLVGCPLQLKTGVGVLASQMWDAASKVGAGLGCSHRRYGMESPAGSRPWDCSMLHAVVNKAVMRKVSPFAFQALHARVTGAAWLEVTCARLRLSRTHVD